MISLSVFLRTYLSLELLPIPKEKEHSSHLVTITKSPQHFKFDLSMWRILYHTDTLHLEA
jgi:hypothetical protein